MLVNFIARGPSVHSDSQRFAIFGQRPDEFTLAQLSSSLHSPLRNEFAILPNRSGGDFRLIHTSQVFSSVRGQLPYEAMLALRVFPNLCDRELRLLVLNQLHCAVVGRQRSEIASRFVEFPATR